MRPFPILAAAAILVALGAVAQEPPQVAAPETEVASELRALRQAVEQQGRQIETLARQLSSTPAKMEPPTPEPPRAEPVEAPRADAPAPPRAEAVAPAAEVAGPKHTVAKGETLTSIAKRYNMAVAELQKANKVLDDRKLQIGQVITIPNASGPKPTDAPPTPIEKKDIP